MLVLYANHVIITIPTNDLNNIPAVIVRINSIYNLLILISIIIYAGINNVILLSQSRRLKWSTKNMWIFKKTGLLFLRK